MEVGEEYTYPREKCYWFLCEDVSLESSLCRVTHLYHEQYMLVQAFNMCQGVPSGRMVFAASGIL